MINKLRGLRFSNREVNVEGVMKAVGILKALTGVVPRKTKQVRFSKTKKGPTEVEPKISDGNLIIMLLEQG